MLGARTRRSCSAHTAMRSLLTAFAISRGTFSGPRHDARAELGAQRIRPTGKEAGSGGAEGGRTPDLVNAIHALSQLSYSPTGPEVGGCAGYRWPYGL